MGKTRDEILGRLRVVLEAILPADRRGVAIEEDAGLLGRGIGLDSIEVMMMVGRIEDEFGITIEDDELERRHFETVGRLVSFIEGRIE